MGMPGYGTVYGGYGMGMGGYGTGMPGYGAWTGPTGGSYNTSFPSANLASTAGSSGSAPDLTGQRLGAADLGYGWGTYKGPRVVPNFFDNSLIIQGTPQEYESVLKLLQDLDVPPRQVLIEAKIYQVTLTGSLSNGVQYYLQQLGGGQSISHILTGQAGGTTSGVSLSAGMFVGKSRELLAALSTGDIATHSKVVSSPAIIATDSITASINVGDEVPVLTSTLPSGVQQGGTTQFAQTISSRNTGVTLNITPRINPSGVVTLVIDQDISNPEQPTAGSGIQSPSFSERKVKTQITMQDGDTIAIAGIISEDLTWSSQGIPFLHRIPVLGSLFGQQSMSKSRQEIIIFITPRVIYDTNELADASDDLKAKLRKLRNVVKE